MATPQLADSVKQWREKALAAPTDARRAKMVETFQAHVGAEMAGDLDGTMATMSPNPWLNHTPTLAGGVGREGVKCFYRDHLVGRFFPPDMVMTVVSRTVGDVSVVDELHIKFTHTATVDWLLPGVAPTGKVVEFVVVVIVGFDDAGLVLFEHVYWDSASVLLQLGLIEAKGLPIVGAEAWQKVLDPALPARTSGY